MKLSRSKLKPHLYNLRITLTSLELLEEFQGDKRAYFLAELQNNLASSFIARYGESYKSILILDRDSPAIAYQVKLHQNYANYIKSECIQITEFRIRIPTHMLYLKERVVEALVFRCTPNALLCSPDANTALTLLDSAPNRLLIKNEQGDYEVYAMRHMSRYGSKFKGGF